MTPVRLCLTVAILLRVVWVAGCARLPEPVVPIVTRGGVRFVHIDPDARTVSIAGSFNDWSVTAHPLSRTRSTGEWTSVVPLPSGTHIFMFVVDGARWVVPARAMDFEDDGFGSRNAVVVVPPER